MDTGIGLREILLIIGLLVVFLIIVDGVRRMRKSKQQATELENNEEDFFSNELPHGGARKVEMEDRVIEDTVTMMETFNQLGEVQEIDVIEQHDVIMQPVQRNASVGTVRSVKPILADDEDVPTEADEWGADDMPMQQTTNLDDEEGSAEELIVVTVMAKLGESFSGNSILSAAKQAGLKHGDHDIFHREEQGGIGKRGHLFSMANVLEPGSFNLQEIHKLRTPGVCFFLNLPGPKKSVLAFELLVDAARKVAKSLGGELQDGRRNALTSKGLEQLRQRVVDFEKRHAKRSTFA